MRPTETTRDPSGSPTLAEGNQQTRSQASDLEALGQDAWRVMERGAMSVANTVRENPVVAAAGLFAVGAIVAMAVTSRRTSRQSMATRVERDVARYARDLRRTVRRELNSSGVSDGVSQIGAALSSIDLKPYLRPIVDRAAELAEDAKARVR